jgi:hypothetical protein
MKKRVLSIVVLLTFGLFSQKASAQYYFYNDAYYDNPILFEVGASVGVMNCLTDLGGKKGIGKRFIKDLNLGYNKMCGGAFFGMMYRNAFGARLEASFGKVSSDDAVLASVPEGDIARTRFNRNLNFQSSITEFSLLTELHPIHAFINWEGREDVPPLYSPYLLAGVGYYSFNPQANINNKLIDLQPLRTEGQGFKQYPDRSIYKLRQFNFPLGAGVKYELSPIINLRAEFVYRILTTDYLDDCSTRYIDPAAFAANGFTGVKLANALLANDRQIDKVTGPGGKRGSPTENDAFFSFNLKISMILGREGIR